MASGESRWTTDLCKRVQTNNTMFPTSPQNVLKSLNSDIIKQSQYLVLAWLEELHVSLLLELRLQRVQLNQR